MESPVYIRQWSEAQERVYSFLDEL